jgi:sterol desaturase/sphingolipid hydroxylase (fatty acid hydroxylase superfamily)
MSPVLSFLVLSSLFLTVFALERVPAFQFRPTRLIRPFMTTDGAWYLVATTANLVSTFVFRPQLSKLAIPGVADSISTLPPIPRLCLAVVVYDFVAFAVHVGIHRSDVLWSVHKVHHSSLQLDGLATTRTHLFEHLLRNVPAQTALFALGMPAPTVASALLIYAAFALHGHSNLRVGGRWLELLFVTPRLHRLHHVPATTQNNFGTVLTVWDRLFGRLVVRSASPEERTGVPGEIDEYPQRFLVAFRQPMTEVRARLTTPAEREPVPT